MSGGKRYRDGMVHDAEAMQPPASPSGMVTAGMDVLADGVAVSPPALWRFDPIKPGEVGHLGLVLEVTGDGDEASARIAHELFSERKRQVRAEGYDAQGDDHYGAGELQRAAASYACAAALNPADAAWLASDRTSPEPASAFHLLDLSRALWPWRRAAFKPDLARRMLVKAGGLIIAAIEAIDRKRAREAAQSKEG